MNIKRIFVLGLAMVGAAALIMQPAMAQGGKRVGPQMGPRTGARPGIFQELNLTADQKTKIKTITESRQGEIKAIREDKNLTPADKQTKIQAIRKDMQIEIDKVLTPEQREQLASLRGGIGRIFEKLDLTADQKTKIKTITESRQGEIKAIREDKNLTPADKQAKIQAIRKDIREEISKLLTPEQQKKLAEMRETPKARAPKGPK